MVADTHVEGVGAVECAVGGSRGGGETVEVGAFEVQQAGRREAEGQAHTGGGAGIEVLVVALFEARLIADARGALGAIDIAAAVLGHPVAAVAAQHEVEACVVAAHREVGQQRSLDIEVVIGGLVVLLVDDEVGGIALVDELGRSADAEPAVELIAEQELGVDAVGGIPGAGETVDFLDAEDVARVAQQDTEVEPFGVLVVEDGIGLVGSFNTVAVVAGLVAMVVAGFVTMTDTLFAAVGWSPGCLSACMLGCVWRVGR